MDEKMCLVNSGITNSILRKIKYFQTLTKNKGNVLIVDSGRATIMLPMGTSITIEDALLYPDSTHTLLSYRDIWKNGFHIETHNENNEEFLLITKDNGYGKDALERVSSLPSRLYYTYINPIQYVAYKVIF
jgi:peptide/histidine transporter 3/4